MNSRLDDFNNKFIYVETNPENIIEGKKNALFFRNGQEFFINNDGVIDGKWEKLPYRTVIIPPPPTDKILRYKENYELWLKTTDGYIDEYGDLLPKTGWMFLTNQNVFLSANPRMLHWDFPPPKSSYDIVGVEHSRSYDENFFYAKIGGLWYRTPIAVFDFAPSEGNERPELTTKLPFVDVPRYFPVPANSNAELNNVAMGVQTYDTRYFYIRVSKWKRTTLNVYYDPSKMTMF